jgi:hypothetical protein
MILRRLARFFIAAALLVAQQSALAHQIWHFAAAPAQHAAGADPQGQDAGGDLHTALGAVLGALACAGAAPDFKAPQVDAIPAAALTLAALARLAPSSRGPPTLR